MGNNLDLMKAAGKLDPEELLYSVEFSGCSV